MSINDYVDSIESIAREALGTAKATECCPIHRDVVIRRFDDDAERLAYAIATNILRQRDEMFMREDVMSAIKDELVSLSDECAECSKD
ncbi:MAG TPA: hypothetical protein VII20_17350 [Roseiarcus sp.]